MLKLTFEAANKAELHQSIADYIEDVNTGGSTPGKAASKEKEKTPAKEKEAVKEKDKVKIDAGAIRNAFRETGWDVKQAKKVLKKLGHASIDEIPSADYAEVFEKINEISGYSTKKLAEFLEDEEL